MIIDYKEIPSDLDEMIEEGEFVHGNFSKDFEDAMFYHKLMEYGTYRRSHRIITDKCIKLGTSKVISLLTGKTSSELSAQILDEINKEEIENMKLTAKKFGYTLTKNIL